MVIEIGHTRMVADAEIIELDQVRQCIAPPAGRSDACGAFAEDSIDMPLFQHAFHRFIGHLPDTKRKRVEIDQAPFAHHHAAAARMGVEQHEMATGTGIDPRADFLQETVPRLPITVVHPHQINLPQMHGLYAYIHIGADQVHQPQLCFDARDIGHAGTRRPQVDVLAVGREHLRIVEVALFGGKPQGLERPGRHGNLAHLAVNGLERRSLENHVGIEGMHLVDQCFGSGPEAGLRKHLLVSPAVDRPADKLGARIADERHVSRLVGISSVVAIRVDREELRHGHGTREVTFQHGLRNRTVEIIGVFGTAA